MSLHDAGMIIDRAFLRFAESFSPETGVKYSGSINIQRQFGPYCIDNAKVGALEEKKGIFFLFFLSLKNILCKRPSD